MHSYPFLSILFLPFLLFLFSTPAVFAIHFFVPFCFLFYCRTPFFTTTLQCSYLIFHLTLILSSHFPSLFRPNSNFCLIARLAAVPANDRRLPRGGRLDDGRRLFPPRDRQQMPRPTQRHCRPRRTQTTHNRRRQRRRFRHRDRQNHQQSDRRRLQQIASPTNTPHLLFFSNSSFLGKGRHRVRQFRQLLEAKTSKSNCQVYGGG
jgi:hypothetical protein